MFLAALLVAGAALVLWLELVVRAAAITAAALFLPLVLAGLVWPATAHWARRLADTLGALVLSKLVIAAVISLATGAIAGGLSGSGSGSTGARFGDVVVGIAMLLLAVFAPFIVLRLVPAVEAGSIAHLESARRQLQHAAQRPAALASNIAMLRAKGKDDESDGVPTAGEVPTGGSASHLPGAAWVGSGQALAIEARSLAPVGSSMSTGAGRSPSPHDEPDNSGDQPDSWQDRPDRSQDQPDRSRDRPDHE